MPCRATQDGRVMVESSDKTWSTGEGNGKPLQYSCLENPMNSMKRQKDRILKEDLPRTVGAQYATGDQRRNNSRKNEGMEPKWNNTQLWMWLVIEVKSSAVKSSIVQEPGMLGPWIKAKWKGQTGDGKSEHWHFRNQWTEMDWNGWIRWPSYLLLWATIPYKKWSCPHSQKKKKEFKMQYLDVVSKITEWSLSISRETIKYHSNQSLCPNQ